MRFENFFDKKQDEEIDLSDTSLPEKRGGPEKKSPADTIITAAEKAGIEIDEINIDKVPEVTQENNEEEVA